jgi:molecular chaperone GrpE (heat shock protein)
MTKKYLTRLQMLNRGNEFSATAGILANFLPVLDKLTELRETYGEDEYGKQYNALAGAMKSAFSKMDATEVTLAVGDKIDTTRMVVVDSEYSNDHAVDTVLRPVAMGMELQGNVIRLAECVASLGPEPAEEEAAVEEAVEEEESSDKE